MTASAGVRALVRAGIERGPARSGTLDAPAHVRRCHLPGDLEHCCRRLAEHGKLAGVGCGHDALAASEQVCDEPRAPVLVELAEDVVEEHQRRATALATEQVPLGEKQREKRETLLTLGPIAAKSAAIVAQ